MNPAPKQAVIGKDLDDNFHILQNRRGEANGGRQWLGLLWINAYF